MSLLVIRTLVHHTHPLVHCCTRLSVGIILMINTNSQWKEIQMGIGQLTIRTVTNIINKDGQPGQLMADDGLLSFHTRTKRTAVQIITTWGSQYKITSVILPHQGKKSADKKQLSLPVVLEYNKGQGRPRTSNKAKRRPPLPYLFTRQLKPRCTSSKPIQSKQTFKLISPNNEN